METRTLGRTGLAVSVLGFGCGAVGGLMVRGNPADQERAVARAVELGINYFDTAAMYGNGESERHLGRVLKSLKPDIWVGTKVRVPDSERGRIGAAIQPIRSGRSPVPSSSGSITSIQRRCMGMASPSAISAVS